MAENKRAMALRKDKKILWHCMSCPEHPVLETCCRNVGCFNTMVSHAMEHHDVAVNTPHRMGLRRVWMVHHPRKNQLQQTEEVALGGLLFRRTLYFKYFGEESLAQLVERYQKAINSGTSHAIITG